MRRCLVRSPRLHAIGLIVCQFLFVSVPSNLLAADPPKIERLYPPGGQRGTVVESKLTGTAGDGTPQVWTSRGQLSFDFSEKNDSVTVTIPQDAVPGLHWLRFYNQHGATEPRPFFVGVIGEASEQEPNNQLSESKPLTTVDQSPLPLPLTINGVLEKSEDADMFAVPMTAGQTLVASVEANDQLGSPMDSVLQLLDDRGTTIAQNDDDRGLDSQIVHTATSDGTYHLRLFAFPAAPNSTIKLSAAANYVYRLTITTGPFVDSIVPAVVNVQDSGDVVVRGWNITEAAATIEDRSQQNLVIVAKDAALAKTVIAVPHSSLVETPDQPQALAVPSSLTGVISDRAEADVYTFSGTQKQKLTVTTAARALHSHLDPVVTVASADGKVIKESDDRSKTDLDAEAAFTIPADGEYRVTIADRFGSGGARYFYALTISETKPDFSATLKANHVVLLAYGKPVEIPVTINRLHGFTDTVEFTVQGLPNGVVCEPVLSEDKNDSKKSVTLKLVRSEAAGDEAAAAFSGNIQITGRAQQSNESRFAESSIQNSTQLTADLWLTVVEPQPAPPSGSSTDP